MQYTVDGFLCNKTCTYARHLRLASTTDSLAESDSDAVLEYMFYCALLPMMTEGCYLDIVILTKMDLFNLKTF